MGEILRFTKEQIPEVAALELKVFRGRSGPAGSDLIKYFEEIFFGNPWRSDDLPSLVYSQRGKIVGFLGVVPRCMTFRGRAIRVAVASQLMADSQEYRGLAGVKLLQQYFRGPQDLSLTDGATDASSTAWLALGAKPVPLFSLHWIRVLRCASCLQHLAQRSGQMKRLSKLVRLTRPLGTVTDAFLSLVPLSAFLPPQTSYEIRNVDADGLLDCIDRIGRRELLLPVYERSSFPWLMSQAASLTKLGEMQMVTVYCPKGQLVGWYVRYAKSGGYATVLQLGAVHDHAEQVLLALLKDAWTHGCIAVTGQTIPSYLPSLARQHCILRFWRYGVLVHSANPEILACILQGDAGLSRLDGEWWMRFAYEDWS